MMNTVPLRALSMLAPALLAVTAVAAPPVPGEFVEIDPGYEDASPLSTSLRSMQLDLRVPTAFDRVYRVEGIDDRFMRAQGGLYVLFPRSTYLPVAGGEIALIPNDSTFYIGRPSLDQLVEQNRRDHAAHGELEDEGPSSPGAARRMIRPVDPTSFQSRGVLRSFERVDLRVHESDERPASQDTAQPVMLPPRTAPLTQRPGQRLTPPPIVDDAAYRQSRLRLLLRRAAAAARSESGRGAG